MWVVHVAVVAAHGGDELLHAVLGAAVVGGARLVHKPRILHRIFKSVLLCGSCGCGWR